MQESDKLRIVVNGSPLPTFPGQTQSSATMISLGRCNANSSMYVHPPSSSLQRARSIGSSDLSRFVKVGQNFDKFRRPPAPPRRDSSPPSTPPMGVRSSPPARTESKVGAKRKQTAWQFKSAPYLFHYALERAQIYSPLNLSRAAPIWGCMGMLLKVAEQRLAHFEKTLFWLSLSREEGGNNSAGKKFPLRQETSSFILRASFQSPGEHSGLWRRENFQPSGEIEKRRGWQPILDHGRHVENLGPARA